MAAVISELVPGESSTGLHSVRPIIGATGQAARSLALPAAGLVTVVAASAAGGVTGWVPKVLELLRLLLSRGQG